MSSLFRKISFKLVSLFILSFLLTSLPSNIESPVVNHEPYAKIETHRLRPSAPQINFDLLKLPVINYEAIYRIWNHPNPEMLIITPNNQEFVNATKLLKEWNEVKGVKTEILSNWSLFEGKDNVEKLRNAIKYYYEQDGIRWVLLAGDAQEDLIPIRYVYNPDVVEYGGSEYGSYDDYYKPTDFYYADLTNSWDSDSDGRWGESAVKNAYRKDEIDWTPEVYVGRFPASTAQELEIMVNKTVNYDKLPNEGDWMKRMLLASGVSDYSPAEDETRLSTYIIQNYLPLNANFKHLCEYTASYTPPDPKTALSQTIFTAEFNAGYSTVFFAGHGNPFQLIKNPSNEVVFTQTDANATSNENMPALVYAFACTTTPVEMNDDNIGEVLLKQKNSGAIGFVGATRLTWYLTNDENLEKLNRGAAKLFWKEFFEEKKFQQGKALYDSKTSYMTSSYFENPSVSMELEYERKNVLSYCLLGDPELDVYTNKPVSAKDPFPANVREGEFFNITIKDINDVPVPFGRFFVKTSEGRQQTFYADRNGVCKVSTPADKTDSCNATITGHNLRLTQFEFNTTQETSIPTLKSIKSARNYLIEGDSIEFSFEANDSVSGIESVFVAISDDDFETYEFYRSILSEGSQLTYNLEVADLIEGNYEYIAIARDLANNTVFLSADNFWFEINPSDENEEDNNGLGNLLFIVALISSLVGVSIVSCIVFYKMKIFSKINWKRPTSIFKRSDIPWYYQTKQQKKVFKRAQQFRNRKKKKN